MMDIAGIVYGISIWALPLIFAVTLHEAAHGYAALALGDDTAKRAGRLSLNPLRHIDAFGTIVFPILLLLISRVAGGQGMLFGWAKPVPVNFAKLRHARAGMILVALAGPAMNLALAVLALVAVRLVPHVPEMGRTWFFLNLDRAIEFNLLLCVFNMIPIPPLDGGRVLVGLLPRVLAIRVARLENAGVLILLGAMFVLPPLGRAVGFELDPFDWLRVPIEWLAEGLMWAVGPTA